MRRWVNTFRDDAGGWQMVKWWASTWEKKMLRGARLTTFHNKFKCTDAQWPGTQSDNTLGISPPSASPQSSWFPILWHVPMSGLRGHLGLTFPGAPVPGHECWWKWKFGSPSPLFRILSLPAARVRPNKTVNPNICTPSQHLYQNADLINCIQLHTLAKY